MLTSSRANRTGTNVFIAKTSGATVIVKLRRTAFDTTDDYGEGEREGGREGGIEGV